MTTQPIEAPSSNPYIVGRPVSGSGRFFGFEAPLQRLRRTFLEVSTPGHLAIVGETRSGKTSLLTEFLRRHGSELMRRFTVVPLDLSADFSRGSTQEFYQQFLEHTWDIVEREKELSKKVKETVAAALVADKWGKAQINLKRAFKLMADEGVSLFYVLDEFDSCPYQFEKPDSQALKLLRLLGENDAVTYVTASRRPIVDIEKDSGISSNFAGIFSLVDLDVPLLDPNEAKELCQVPGERAGIAWEPTVVERTISLSGRHPFLLQGLCYCLFEEAALSNEEQRLASLDRQARAVFAQLFGMMTTRLRKTGLFDSLVKVVTSGGKGIPVADVDRLTRLNYLCRDVSGNPKPFSPLLVDAIIGRAKTTTGEDEPVRLQEWGIAIGSLNVIVEGETDRDYLILAGERHSQACPEEGLLDGVNFVPGGLGRKGGAKVVARRLVAVREAIQNPRTKVIALLDLDDMGLATKRTLDSLGFQNNRDYLMLDRKYFPIKGIPEQQVEVEIEDLISNDLLARFGDQVPDAVESTYVVGGKGRRMKWKGEYKERMRDFIRQEATAKDLENLVDLLRTIRAAAKL